MARILRETARERSGALLAGALGAALVASAFVSTAPLGAQFVLDAGDAILPDLGGGTSTISVTSGQPVQSITISLAFDPLLLEAVSAAPVGAAAAAEGFFTSILPAAGGVLVAIIADAQTPFDGHTLPPLAAEAVVAVTWRPTVLLAAAVDSPLTFLDGVFDNPPVTNTLVVAGGSSITQANGLILEGGILTILAPPPPTFRIEPRTLLPDETAPIALLLDNPTGPIDGYTAAVARPVGLDFLAVETAGTVVDLFTAEFAAVELDPNGAAIQVVLDSDPPFGGQTIPLGTDLPLALILSRCPDSPVAPEPAETIVVSPADGVVGAGPAVNRVSIGGLELAPTLLPGEITCSPVPLAPHVFLAGALGPGGEVGPVTANPGDTVSIGFWYTDPQGGIQGVQLAVCIPCTLGFVPNSFSAIGTVLDEAEFLLATYDNEPGDGDGCEMTVGALLDALPPFDGVTLPISTTPLALGSVQITVSPTATPLDCLEVAFCDFIDGGGGPLIENVAIIDNLSIFNFAKVDGEICIDGGTTFRRGDANQDGAVDLADPITALMAVFGLIAPLACPAAADADAGGTLDLADPVLLLEHLFAAGPPPAAPYPGCGVAPGEDCPVFDGCP